MRIAVIVASLGRPRVLSALMDELAAQSRPPDRTIVCLADPADAPDAAALAAASGEIVLSPKGSCAQRNAGLDRLANAADAVVFFDDDFVPARDWLREAEKLFEEKPDLAGLTGAVVLDGATGPGFDLADARAALQGPAPSQAERPVPNLYGCNMAFRLSALEGVRFDERLPLYGWLEDVDFSAQAGRRGVLLRTGRLVGAHLGAKSGRTSGVRFGYSQIVNPIYLLRKRTIGAGQAWGNVFRTFAANHLRAIEPESYVDRRGRVRGNWLAIGDLLRGRITPERILDLD